MDTYTRSKLSEAQALQDKATIHNLKEEIKELRKILQTICDLRATVEAQNNLISILMRQD